MDKKVFAKYYADAEELLCVDGGLVVEPLEGTAVYVQLVSEPLVGMALATQLVADKVAYMYLHIAICFMRTKTSAFPGLLPNPNNIPTTTDK